MNNLQEAFHILTKGLLTIFQESLVSIFLYGSVARGTQTKESDIDIAVIVKQPYTTEMRNDMFDLAAELDLQYDAVFSVLLIDADKFLEWQDILPFYKNVKTEGVCLWTAA